MSVLEGAGGDENYSSSHECSASCAVWKELQYPVDRRMDGSQGRSGLRQGRKNMVYLAGRNPIFLGRLARSLIITLVDGITY